MTRADSRIVKEVQMLYRMGATYKKLHQAYAQDCSLHQMQRFCKGIARDLRDQRILKMWEQGNTCKEIVAVTGFCTSTVRGITKGTKGGQWKRVHNCKYCGKEFKQKRYAAGSFCRRECKRRSMSLHFSGGKKLQRNEEIHKLRDEGMTYQAIADKFGLSRQRVFGIVRLDEAEV